MRTAARMRSRRQLSGPPLPPELSAVAAAVAAGVIGEDHLRAISRTIDVLPSCVSATDRDDVETSLAREATKNDAAILKTVGRRIDETFNPDRHVDEQDRARRRRLHVGPQGPDGMSRLSGWINPETRCYVETLTAPMRPGRHLPDATLTETPDERSPAQRCHDGTKLGLKTGIASGGLSQHRGHPVTVIVHTTLAELNQATHPVTNPDIPMPAPTRTGGDTARPIRDLIRIATTDQHIICHAQDGDCTRPNCQAPGYHCQVHHSPNWSPDGATDADKLYFACPPDHTLITDGTHQSVHTDTDPPDDD